MRRALELAARGRGMTGTNPMVGAVIVAPDGRIIGEGWHRRYGRAHAEVNAVNSVLPADEHLLRESTIYVTLEPCSHYGKTPPCAQLLIDKKIPRVVVGAGDPNPKVNGRGISMLREAGAEVITGMLARESEDLNFVFFTAFRLRRPYVTLKWAQSADGFMDWRRDGDLPAMRFSNPLTAMMTMKLRSENGAILTTAVTAIADRSTLTLREWPGSAPHRFVIDRAGRLTPDAPILQPEGTTDVLTHCESIAQLWKSLFENYGITSVLVEGGPTFLSAVLDSGLWDALRVEIAPFALGRDGDKPAPSLPHAPVVSDRVVAGNRLKWFRNIL